MSGEKEQNDAWLGIGRNGGGADGAERGAAEWPELAALEAALSSLVPRADGLDRDRLLFLVGRASAGSAPGGRWAMRLVGTWAAGVTAAALVLALLLVQAQSKLRVASARLAGPAAPKAAAPSGERPQTKPAKPNAAATAAENAQSAVPQPAAENRSTRPTLRVPARAGGPADWTHFGSRAAYLRSVARLLNQDIDPWPSMAGLGSEPRTEEARVVPYRELLKELLDEQARLEASDGASAGELSQGVAS